MEEVELHLVEVSTMETVLVAVGLRIFYFPDLGEEKWKGCEKREGGGGGGGGTPCRLMEYKRQKLARPHTAAAAEWTKGPFSEWRFGDGGGGGVTVI